MITLSLSAENIDNIFGRKINWFKTQQKYSVSIYNEYNTKTIYNIHNFLDLDYLYSLGNHIYVVENEELDCYEMIF